MNRRWFTIENLLYIAAFILALGFRYYNLGRFPLSDVEADWALQALSLSRGEAFSPGSQPAIITLTGFLFSIFGSSNALARFWPALAGSALVFFPVFFRDKLGRNAALIMAFGLALDPGLVSLSRQVGSPMLAISFTSLSLGFAYIGMLIPAGILAGLALLSGPAFIYGLVVLLLAWFAARAFNLPRIYGQNSVEPESKKAAYIKGLLALVGTLLIAGTSFFQFPQGLGAWLGSIPAYFSGWLNPAVVPVFRPVAALLIYQPIAVIFGVISSFHHWRDKHDFVPHLVMWSAVAIFLAVIYPARQVSDIVWAIIPLWALAAIELGDLSELESEQRYIAVGQAGLIFILLAVLWLNFAGLTQPVPDPQAYTLRLVVIGGLLALGVVTTVLIGLGWSWEIARTGAILGLCAGLGVYMISNIWNSSQLRPYRQQDLWAGAPTTGDSDLLYSTIGDISEWNTGLRNRIDITVAVDSPALHWLLRDFSQVEFLPDQSAPAAGDTPSIVILQDTQEELSIGASYRGQDFAWWVTPGWQGSLPSDLPNWLTTRNAPLELEGLILWAREDLFPGEPPEVVDTTIEDLSLEREDIP